MSTSRASPAKGLINGDRPLARALTLAILNPGERYRITTPVFLDSGPHNNNFASPESSLWT